MRYFSTFTGIGGFELGIRNAYREAIRRSEEDTPGNDEAGQGLVTAQGQGASATNGRTSTSASDWLNERPLCVGYSEIDKWADKVYQRHWWRAKNYGDITKINAKELPDFDCLVGGFPCQAFSIAGLRNGFEDTRGTLFFDLARILRVKRPRLFVFENVKGLLSHDSGNTFRTIIATITELGYDCQWSVLNSKDFGVPQNRERVIIVGHLRGTARPQVFPIGEDDKLAFAERQRISGEIQPEEPGRASDDTEGGILQDGQDGHLREPRIVYKYRKGGEEALMDTYNVSAIKASNQGNQRSDGTSLVVEEAHIRRLTPLECERLQGFPDEWTLNGAVECDHPTSCPRFSRAMCRGHDLPISDTQRYKMCGNAVTTNVIQAVFERIFV